MNQIPHTISRPLRETIDQRKNRQADYFREIAEMNMDSARIAHTTIKRAHAAGDDTHKPTLDLARATRAVVTAVNAENALFRAERAPRAPASDPRRAPLCTALIAAAKSEPDPALRAALVRDIPALVEENLVADPDAETPIDEHLFDLADRLHLTLDMATLSDEVLGMEPRTYSRDAPDDVPDD